MIDAMHWARSGMASATSSCVPTTQGKQLQKAGKGSFPFLPPFAPTLYSLQCFPSCFIIGEKKKIIFPILHSIRNQDYIF